MLSANRIGSVGGDPAPCFFASHSQRFVTRPVSSLREAPEGNSAEDVAQRRTRSTKTVFAGFLTLLAEDELDAGDVLANSLPTASTDTKLARIRQEVLTRDA